MIKMILSLLVLLGGLNQAVATSWNAHDPNMGEYIKPSSETGSQEVMSLMDSFATHSNNYQQRQRVQGEFVKLVGDKVFDALQNQDKISGNNDHSVLTLSTEKGEQIIEAAIDSTIKEGGYCKNSKLNVSPNNNLKEECEAVRGAYEAAYAEGKNILSEAYAMQAEIHLPPGHRPNESNLSSP